MGALRGRPPAQCAVHPLRGVTPTTVRDVTRATERAGMPFGGTGDDERSRGRGRRGAAHGPQWFRSA